MALEKCCFCCKLENGAFIWGIVSSILSVIALALSYNEEFVYSNFPAKLVNWLVLIRLWIIIFVIASVLLAYGASSKNYRAMLPWIIICGISLVPLLPFAFIVCLLAAPIFFPFYIWWCMCSAYQNVQLIKEGHSGAHPTANRPLHGIVGYSSPPYSMHSGPVAPPRYKV